MVRRFTLLLCLLASCCLPAHPLYATDDEAATLKAQHEYYQSVPNVKPKSREVYFYEMRNYPLGRIPQNARAKALNYVDNVMLPTAIKKGPQVLASQPQWQPIGPFDVGGRVRSIVVHPTNPNRVWIGTAAGGAWRTTDGGQSWEPIFDEQNASAFGSLAIDPANPDVLWAATGEIEASVDAYLGNGIYKSTDGGDTWTHVGLANIGAFSKIYVHPLNSNFIVAGAVKNGAGFYRSVDGGATWEKTFSGPVSDVSISHQSENDVFIGVTGEGVYYSADGGKNFEFLGNGFPTFNVGRVSVQVSKSHPDILQCLIVRHEYISETERTEYADIYRSANRGQQWTKTFSGDAEFFRNQGFYNHYIDIHPTNPDIAFAGGIDIFRTDNGITWNNVTFVYNGGHVHPDQHCIAFAPSNPDIIYTGNDGGMYVSKDGGYNWTAINTGLAITQFYKMGVDQQADAATYGGTQDNGTHGSLNNVVNWAQIGGGDGGYTSVDPGNSNIIYGSYQQGAMWKYNKATGFATAIGPPRETDEPLFIAPHIIDPEEYSILYHGRKHLYISFDAGKSWDIVPDLPALEGSISAIAVSPAAVEYLYVGSNRGEIYRSNDGGGTWQKVSDALPKRFVTDIIPSRTEPQTAYLALAGFGSGHVFKTTNAGQTWTDISNGLPDIPCGSLVLDPDNENAIFAGTDIGVFASYDAGATWFPFGEGLPRTHVADLEFHLPTHTLRAATHGRSMWEVKVPTTAIEAAGITSPAGGENYNAQSSQVISWYGITGSVKVEYSVDDGASWNIIQSNVTGSYMRWSIPDRPTITGRIRITPNSSPTPPLVSRTFAINPFTAGSVLAQGSVSHVPYGVAYDGQGGLWTTSFYGTSIYKLNAQTFQIEQTFDLPAGDSLCTDITIDPETQTLYVHKLNNSTTPNGGKIIVMTTSGQILRTMTSPCTAYPIGLAWVDGVLVAGDRDTRKLFRVDPQTGQSFEEYMNPFQKSLGPRGLCYDGSQYCYQVSTDFSGQSLQGTYNVRFATSKLSEEVDRLELRTAMATINARGIDYDERDGTFWVSDFDGNIFKTAGFEVVTDVPDDSPAIQPSAVTLRQIAPNPFSDNTTIGFALRTALPLRVDVYTTSGARVTTLHDGTLPAGNHTLTFPGAGLPTGVYRVVFSVQGVPVATQNAILLR